MSIENRPYVGTWKMGVQKLVQHTPDAMVYINGDLALPGCQKCNSRIDLQKFVTEVSVDAGTDPTGASASFSLSLPPHHQDSFVRDGQFILKAGLEVHIYMRGYFPVKGMFSNLDTPTNRTPDSAPLTVPSNSGGRYTPEAFLNRGEKVSQLTPQQLANLQKLGANVETIHQYMDALGKSGGLPGFEGDLKVGNNDAFSAQGHVEHSQHHDGNAIDMVVTYTNTNGNTVTVDQTTTWAALNKLRSAGYIEHGGIGAYVKATANEGTPAGSPKASGYTPTTTWTDVPHYDIRGTDTNWCWYNIKQPDGKNLRIEGGGKPPASFTAKIDGLPDPASMPGVVRSTEHDNPAALIAAGNAGQSSAPLTPLSSLGPTALGGMGLGGYDIENILAYPYYHVFHGVVNQVTHSYSGGIQTASIQCVSMLHFWQFHRMSTNAAIFGTVANTGNRPSLIGNNFTGKHPYEIMYILHKDTGGAAAGVAWAQERKTNQDAHNSITGDSLYSLSNAYIKQRFNLRDIKLRMHGATGEMFNSLQSAFLGTQSSSELTAMLRGRFNGPVSKGEGMLKGALAVGLGNKRKMEALLWTKNQSGGLTNQTKMELSMPEMIAFVSDIGQWGSVQLFESTYESKLDIANKVCEVTGFEFYQDVDGDFVFKPPMYNLDTSASRVYRIEDIDIITISFDDKEPAATYITAKGSSLQANLKGTGTENEWGAQGQYIDFRLVAQFGWRPADFETSYFTDKRSMFLAGVNRLDILNAATKTSAVTIPLRPELRPGYPVYIPYLDSFYYCNSFAHSFSVGGSCTTSLQMIAKRSKFFAPGHPKQQGIGAIDLGETMLPEKPLQVLDKAGRPRLSGFPNVVMALDTQKIDPLFFVVGVDVDKLERPGVLEQVLEQAVQLKVLTSWPVEPGKIGPYYAMVGEGKDDAPLVWFYLPTANSAEVKSSQDIITAKEHKKVAVDPMAAAKELAKLQAANSKKLAVEFKSGSAAKQKAAEAQKAATAAMGTKSYDKLQDKANKAKAAADTATKQYENAKIAAANAEGSTSNHALIKNLQTLIKKVREAFSKPEYFQSRFSGDPNSAITILDMLADKKANFSNGSLPGSFRYYSASHPDPDQQGQRLLTLNISPNKEATGAKRIVTSPANVEPEWARFKVPTYVKDSDIITPAGSPHPEAQLRPVNPQRGIKVLTGNPKKVFGEVYPTSEIREMMFATHQVEGTKPVSSNSKIVQFKILGGDVRQAFGNSANKGLGTSLLGVGTPSPSDTLGDAMTPWMSGIQSMSVTAIKQARASNPSWTNAGKIPDFPGVFPPAFISYRGGDVSTTAKMDSFWFADTVVPGTPKEQAFPDSDAFKLSETWGNLAQEYGKLVFDSVRAAQREWVVMMQANEIPADDITSITSAFIQSLLGLLKIDSIPKEKQTSTATQTLKNTITSPVFPVSDARGYQVVGSYRYGRDVDIDPDGVFDSLHNQDLLSLVDKNLVAQAERAVSQGKPVDEAALIAALRKNWSDASLLAHGIDPANMFVNGVSNYIANKGKDGIQKLPIINAAYSLADLAPHTSRDFCSCKAAEADVLLDIAGTAGFVQFTGDSADDSSGQDAAVTWVQTQTAKVSIPWTQSQIALRGTAKETGSSSVITSVLSSASAFMDHARGTDQASQNAAAALRQSQQNVVDLKNQLLHPPPKAGK